MAVEISTTEYNLTYLVLYLINLQSIIHVYVWIIKIVHNDTHLCMYDFMYLLTVDNDSYELLPVYNNAYKLLPVYNNSCELLRV